RSPLTAVLTLFLHDALPILRIIFWFNPLIYIYQSRIAELHEFIADTHTVKTNQKEHYQHLLEEVFKTESISFINQFFNHSLIKKDRKSTRLNSSHVKISYAA